MVDFDQRLVTLFAATRRVMRFRRGLMGQDAVRSYSRVDERVKDSSRSFKVGGCSNEMGCVPLFLCFQHCGIGT
jgi:hypothetical protein